MQSAPDLVVLNAHIITVEENFSTKEPIAIRDGRIIFVGSTSELKALFSTARQEIFLRNLNATPCIMDSHIYIMAIGVEEMTSPGGKVRAPLFCIA